MRASLDCTGALRNRLERLVKARPNTGAARKPASGSGQGMLSEVPGTLTLPGPVIYREPFYRAAQGHAYAKYV